MPDADLSDAASQNQARAKEVVERAIAAMGGRQALLAITAMRAKVWIQSHQHIIPGPPSIIRNVPTYTYPIEYWHYSGLDTFTRKPIKVEISLDLNTPNPTYALRNPPEKSIFPSLFNSRCYLFAVFGQGHKAQLRHKAEAAQWHFIDRFFGEGIKLHYLDAEYFSRQPVEDWRYGRYYEAFFDRNSALLLAVRESFTPTEQEWYRKARRRGYPNTPLYGPPSSTATSP